MLANWLHAKSHQQATRNSWISTVRVWIRTFLETELFGHEKGAFTSAVAAKRGLLEIANHGTVFLDEIGDVDLQVQPKLLKVLESGRFRRLGKIHDRFAECPADLCDASRPGTGNARGGFRADLFYRINIILLEVPVCALVGEDLRTWPICFLRCIVPDGQAIALDRSALGALCSYSSARKHSRAPQCVATGIAAGGGQCHY